MTDFTITCDKCGKEKRVKFPTRATLSCQSCGCHTGRITFPEGTEENALVLKCSKCQEEFVVRSESSSLFQCHGLKCGWVILEVIELISLSCIKNVLDTPTKPESKPIFPHPIAFQLVKEKKLPVRIAIPYYYGGPRIQRAIESWIHPEVVFVLTDYGVIPPGNGVCSQLFTEKNSKALGLSDKTKPYLIDILAKLLKMFPDDEYYGYFNSDVILPLSTPINSLLPKKGKNIAFHHRREYLGKPEDPIHKLEEKYQTYCGKDGFICDRKTAQDIVDNVEDQILGAATWDNGLALWAIKKYGADKVDLRYGEIWHQLHDQEWGYDDKETIFNRKQWDKVGLPDAIRNSVNWYKVGEGIPNTTKIKKLGIVQPGRIGDIIIVLPIAKWYYDLGYRVYWPVSSDYMDLFKYINYVHAIDLGPGLSGVYSRSKAALSPLELDFELDLGIGFGRNESDWKQSEMSFDEWKYAEAGVPFEERFNLRINRNYQKEWDLERRLLLENKKIPALTHSVGSKGRVHFEIKDALEITPIDGFSVFDWIGIIEQCPMIYCVDSCIAHLVNQLGLAKGRRFFRPLANYYGRSNNMAIPKINWGREKKDPDSLEIIVESTGKNPSALDANIGEGKLPPIHFFTIVLNGMPFVKYHIDMMKKLPYDWHWHIVEGVANLKYCTQWSVANGGRIDETSHRNGLSNDGTTEYIDELARDYPDKVSLYRKKKGELWDGKVEMVNAPIESLPSHCLLWEIDVDEFWSVENIIKLYEMFQNNPTRMGAIVPSHFFVGPNKFVSSQNTWATQPHDSFRVARFVKGMHWKKHEPPTLVDKNGKDWGRKYLITRKETLSAGVFFQHFAYVIPEQLKFKESYYGYKNALECWKNLQLSKDNPLDPTKFLSWARPSTVEIWDESIHGPLLFKQLRRRALNAT